MAERRKTHHSWKTRRDMVIRGMTISLPWFAFINVSFALIILLRRVLFNDLTPPWLNEKALYILLIYLQRVFC